MNNYYLLCVDDEPDVLDAVVRDLSCLEDFFPIETAQNADEAEQVIENLLNKGDHVAVIFCDHVMPGKNGVDLLIDMQKRGRTAKIRKVLLTGQAGHESTIEAVNQANLNHYIAKPWKRNCSLRRPANKLPPILLMSAKNLSLTSHNSIRRSLPKRLATGALMLEPILRH